MSAASSVSESAPTVSDGDPRVLGILAVLLVSGGAAVGVWSLGRGPEPVPGPATLLRIDPNTAPMQALLALPQVGPARAQAIAREREKRPFQSLEELARRVPGIGPARLAAMRPNLEIAHARHAPDAPEGARLTEQETP